MIQLFKPQRLEGSWLHYLFLIFALQYQAYTTCIDQIRRELQSVRLKQLLRLSANIKSISTSRLDFLLASLDCGEVD